MLERDRRCCVAVERNVASIDADFDVESLVCRGVDVNTSGETDATAGRAVVSASAARSALDRQTIKGEEGTVDCCGRLVVVVEIDKVARAAVIVGAVLAVGPRVVPPRVCAIPPVGNTRVIAPINILLRMRFSRKPCCKENEHKQSKCEVPLADRMSTRRRECVGTHFACGCF